MIEANLNIDGWLDGFDMLSDIRESLARRMGVEGGVLLRDKAKEKAPVSDPTVQSKYPAGNLRDSLYLARDTDASTDYVFVYKISWNAKQAWYGKLLEFGHWMPYRVHISVNGQFYTDKGERDMRNAGKGKRVKATAFLRRTGDEHAQDALRAMLDRGKREFPELVRENKR